MKEKIYCCHCGDELLPEDAYYINGNAYCPTCLDEVTTVCTWCASRILEDSNAGDDETPLCPECYDRHYCTCDECGSIILRENIYYDSNDRCLCESCYYKDEDDRAIHDYGYKPEPIFYGKGRYIGVELEIDCGGQLNENAESFLDIANKTNEHIYIKYDGSLDDGMELVSYPMTLDYHMNRMPWKQLLEKAVEKGYRSHKTGTCGLHMHVDRRSLGKTYSEQEENIAKILFLVEKYWNELLIFSRRTQYQMDRWAARYGFKEKPVQVLDNAKKSGLGRYACVNLNNRSTIEFRMWRGTLKYNTLIATLQLVDRLCSVAVSFSEEELQNLSWTGFVSAMDEKELIAYLKERRLYINEPVTAEEEE